MGRTLLRIALVLLAPENPWYRDVLADPTVTLSAEGRRERYRAEVV